jgi:hypothetical protein
MNRISTIRSPKAPARLWPRLDIESETGRLGPDRVFIQRTPIGYVCAGLGDPARLLRLAFEEPREVDAARKHENYETNPIFAATCRRLDKAVEIGGAAKARRLGLEIPLGAIDDPALRRLAIAAALIKAGFDPGQARDDDGRWTSSGGDNGGSGGGASAGVTVNTLAPVVAASGVAAAGTAVLGETAGAGAGWSLWNEGALALLPRIPLVPGALGLAGGLLLFLVPGNRSGSLESSGTLPDNPDIAFHRSEGRLQFFQLAPDGTRTTLYDGFPGEDNFYRNADGRIIARDLGYEKGFVLDPSAVSMLSPPTMDARAKEKEKEKDPEIVAAQQRLLSQARTTVRTADPAEVCPDPDLDKPGSESASPRAQAYQTQVTQLPYGVAFKLGGVFFDGCRYWSDGTMLEAKGPGLEQHYGPDGWEFYFTGVAGFMTQMAAQSKAAKDAGKIVEWHVAEKPVADFLEAYSKEMKFTNVKVIHEEALQKFPSYEIEEAANATAVELVPFLVVKAWYCQHVRRCR